MAESRPGSVQHVTHGLFGAFRAAIWGVCVARVVLPEFDGWLGVFPGLMRPAPVAVGLALVLGGFAWVAYVHNFMACDWRSGVTDGEDTALLTEGPFRQSRNPMFLGVALAQFGFFLALPSVFSLICLAVGLAALVMQARFEEERLRVRFGEPYRRYAETTPRWLGFSLRRA